jgi:phosphohistidine phosphatase
MFERLQAHSPAPEWIVSSDAVRAAATARLLLEALSIGNDKLALESGLYHAGVDQIAATARALPDGVRTAALVGHNPGMTYAANQLVANLELDNLPTCGIVGIEFATSSWADIGTGSLAYFDFPKNPDGPILRSRESP